MFMNYKWQEIEGLNQKPWRVKNEKSICRFSKKFVYYTIIELRQDLM
jgi:hypothetical protein